MYIFTANENVFIQHKIPLKLRTANEMVGIRQ